MTKWMDLAENPERNARFWQESGRIDALLLIGTLAVFATGLGYFAWQTHCAEAQCVCHAK